MNVSGEEIIVLIVFLIVISGLVLSGILNEKYKRIVFNSSEKLKALLAINARYCFNVDLQNEYKYTRRLNSKRKFDQFKFNIFFDEIIENKKNFICQLIEQVHQNQNLFKQYILEVEQLPSFITREQAKSLHIPYHICLKKETKLMDQFIDKPVIDPVFRCCIKYTSPQGRNAYFDYREYSFQNLIQHYEQVCKNIEERSTQEYQRKRERSKLSPSLRYDVLRRDQFRCVLCGQTASDGVKLHVDHIVPIAKGGKTVMENLRTLCDRCNLGKSDKLEYNPEID